MCDCLPPPLTHSLIGTQKLQTRTSLFPQVGFPVLPRNTKLKPKSSLKVSKSESFELYEELGFKDFETNSKDREMVTPKKEIKDILEFKDELASGEELVQGNSSSEEVDKIVERKGLRKGRQVVRRSNVLAKQVISVDSALSLGFVSQLWVDTNSWVVLVVEVRPSILSGEIERFFLEDVRQVGDVVLVEDESVLEEDIKMLGLDTLVGYNVVTPSRRSIGKVRGFTFNINSGAVELLELDSFGFSIIPSSLVSTYALFIEDVIDVEADTVVVHEVAASRVQRLTKGFWDTPNAEILEDQLEEHEYPNHERRPIQSYSRRNRRKFTSTTREYEDDLQPPMDFL